VPAGYRHDVELGQLEAFAEVPAELLPAGCMKRARPNSAVEIPDDGQRHASA
jgi:hypothetical protein